MNPNRRVSIRSTHFCTTWFPFWSRTQRRTFPSSSAASFDFVSSSTVSSAFCTTRQP